jgi:hypothetical protein
MTRVPRRSGAYGPLAQRKLAERTAVLYARALDRWTMRSPFGK